MNSLGQLKLAAGRLLEAVERVLTEPGADEDSRAIAVLRVRITFRMIEHMLKAPRKGETDGSKG